MTDREAVLAKYPKAFCFIAGAKKEIRRPREKTDLPALVHYVLLSGIEYTIEGAWKDAARRLAE